MTKSGRSAPVFIDKRFQKIQEQYGNILETYYFCEYRALIINSSRGAGSLLTRPGNRYVEGEPLTIGYLMLDDYLGFPYYRLFNIG